MALLYPNPCYNEVCYEENALYIQTFRIGWSLLLISFSCDLVHFDSDIENAYHFLIISHVCMNKS